MESMKDKITSWLKYFQDYINSFSFVEKEKNIVYFSKFSLDISEFYLIHEFVKTLKENIFKKNIEQFRYCLKNIILLNKDKTSSEKEKIIILYSACLFIYYKKFRFNTNCTFEQYFDNDFINTSKTIFKFEIKNNELFKIFAFYFFSIIQKQIIALDYSKIQKLKKYYNYMEVENKNEEEMEIEINNGSSQKMNEGFKEQTLTFLISAKEKIIDLVFETSGENQVKNLNLFPNEINDMNNRFQKLNNMNFENNDKNEDNKKNSDKSLNQLNTNKISDNIYENKHNDNKSEMNIDDCSPQKPKTFNVNKNRINIINYNTINNDNNVPINNLFKDSNSNFLNYMHTDCSNKNNNNINNIKDNSMSTNINNFSKKNTIDSNNSNNSGNFNNTSSTINKFPLNDSSSVPLFNNLDSILNAENDINNKKIKHNTYSKRIIGELIKSEFDNKTMEIIEEVSKIIDEKYLDKFLNNPSKTVTMIQYFCCYVVEFTPDMLQNICPKYKDILKNFGIKFIILAKDLYNTTMEIFSTIYDLSYTNFDTFIDLTKDCGIQLQHSQGLYKIFRDYSIILYNEKKRKGGNNNIMNVLRKLFEQENQNWRGIIKQKANEFTNFYKIFYE